MFVPMIKFGTLGEFNQEYGKSKDEVDIMKLGLQHTYLDVRFVNVAKSKPKPKRKAKGIGSQIEKGTFSPRD